MLKKSPEEANLQTLKESCYLCLYRLGNNCSKVDIIFEDVHGEGSFARHSRCSEFEEFRSVLESTIKIRNNAD